MDDQVEDASLALPPLSMRRVHLEEFQGAGKSLDLWADEAKLYRDEERVYIQGVRILRHMQERTSTRTVELVGREGSYDLSEYVATVMGEVRIRSMEGHTLNTDLIRYDHPNDMIKGPGPVHVESLEGWTEGVGFQMDTKNDTVILLDQVRTFIRPAATQRVREMIP